MEPFFLENNMSLYPIDVDKLSIKSEILMLIDDILCSLQTGDLNQMEEIIEKTKKLQKSYEQLLTVME